MHSTTDGAAAASSRPLRADARRNRAKILAAAEVEYAEAGSEAQIDAIAERAGVGVGTVYRHFPTKEALVGEMVRERFEAMTREAQEALRLPEPWAAFEAFLRGCARRCAEDVGTQHAFLAIDARVADRLAGEAGLDAAAQRLIDRGIADGSIRPDFRATEIGMLMCGLSASLGTRHPEWDWRRHLEILLDGLRARPA